MSEIKAHSYTATHGGAAYKLEWFPARRASETPSSQGLKTNIVRCCSYCGSCHPEDLAKALREGKETELYPADRKYGWPHKFYARNMPNPFPEELEIRSGRYVDDKFVAGPGEPAGPHISHKFYTEHLQDATPEDRDVIEKAMGMHVTFRPDGAVAWRPYGSDQPPSPPVAAV